jgi:hypothetical protein
MDMDDTIVLLAAAPATAYREFLYRPGGQLARWIGDWFEVVAMPGHRIGQALREGDVLLEVTLGRISLGRCVTLAGRDLELVASRSRLAHGQLVLRPRSRMEMTEPPPVESDVGHPVIAQIFENVQDSPLRTYRWNSIGLAPLAYLKGMALTYARVYCHYRLEPGQPENFRDPFAVKMAKAAAPNADITTDAVAKFAAQLQALGADLSVAGVDVLRSVFTILFGLGMCESSGKFCAGWDLCKQEPPKADNSEAGLFQISYDIGAGVKGSDFKDLYDAYRKLKPGRPGSSFFDVFSEGITCTFGVNCKLYRDGGEIFGAGPGREFQQFCKDNPAFSVELAALGLRVRANHWGTINRSEVEIQEDAWTLLKSVETAIEDLGGCLAVE